MKNNLGILGIIAAVFMIVARIIDIVHVITNEYMTPSNFIPEYVINMLCWGCILTFFIVAYKKNIFSIK